MLVKICRVAALVAGLVLAGVGVLVMGGPEIVLVAFLSVMAWIGARAMLSSVRPGGPPTSAVVAGARTGGVLTVLIGTGAVLGAASMAVLAPVVLIGIALAWSRASRGPAPSPAAPSSGDVEPDDVAGLRLAWDRSQTLLRDLPPGPARWELAEERRRLLDQLEHHDPAGFDRWLRAACHVDEDPPSARPPA